MAAARESLTYEQVLEYLSDREGEDAEVSSYPTYTGGAAGPTSLGLRVRATVGGIGSDEIPADFTEGWAAAELALLDPEGGTQQVGALTLAREWFVGAWLEDRAYLRFVVRADLTAEPFYPPVGQERDPDECRDVAQGELVGWGFAFDFDGSRPLKGRWAEKRAK